MKYFATIIFLFFIHFAVCQEQTDTLIPKSEIENLKQKIHELKQANKKLEYDNYFSLNFYKTDTVSKRKDSIVINFLTKEGKLLRQETNLYHYSKNLGVKTDSSVRSYNDKGLMEFIEGWECTGTRFDTPELGMEELFYVSPHGEKPSYSGRIVYNDKGDPITTVSIFFIGVFRRTKYFYDQNEILIKSIIEEIKPYEFWED